MSKQKTIFICNQCEAPSAQWLGKCPACQAWNSLEEKPQVSPLEPTSSLADFRETLKQHTKSSTENPWPSLESLQNQPKPGLDRFSTGMTELNRVLGGGLVRDSFTLLGGDPGIGKSTLLLQMCQGFLTEQKEGKIFYVSGEESLNQLFQRAKRLGVSVSNRLFLGAETQLEKVFQGVQELQPNIVILDSIQTFSTQLLPGAPGSISQVREVTARLMTLAKTLGISIWLVGHVTKEGTLAGPKTIEHMVDTVLSFEGEGGYAYRLLRTIKNRFGSTRELGIFEMEGEGLKEISNPSSLFLSHRTERLPGVAITCSLEGSRPLLVELQALVNTSGLATPRRTTVGLEPARVSILAAILEKYLRLPFGQQDLFFNVVGGLKLNEPTCDLAAALAMWSSLENKTLPLRWVCLGELGLTGEIRLVSQIETRLQEAHRLGFETAIIPAATPPQTQEKMIRTLPQLKLIPLSRIEELKNVLDFSR